MAKPKLLLFDDDVKIADIIEDSLEDEFDVTWRSKPHELDDVINDEFSVIVTDVSITGYDKAGYQIIDDLRRKMKIMRTPIVVYSAKINIKDIKRECGKLFYAYVDKGDAMGDKLVETCLEASQMKPNIISVDSFEAYFERIGVLDDAILPEDSTNFQIMGIDKDFIKTHKQLIEQLKYNLDDMSRGELEDLLWIIFNRHYKSE